MRSPVFIANIGNPTADKLTAKLFTDYRSQRITKGVSLNSVNREHAYLRAMFNELKRLGHWHLENPVYSVRQFSISQIELIYLSDAQITALLEAVKQSRNADAYHVTMWHSQPVQDGQKLSVYVLNSFQYHRPWSPLPIQNPDGIDQYHWMTLLPSSSKQKRPDDSLKAVMQHFATL